MPAEGSSPQEGSPARPAVPPIFANGALVRSLLHVFEMLKGHESSSFWRQEKGKLLVPCKALNFKLVREGDTGRRLCSMRKHGVLTACPEVPGEKHFAEDTSDQDALSDPYFNKAKLLRGNMSSRSEIFLFFLRWVMSSCSIECLPKRVSSPTCQGSLRPSQCSAQPCKAVPSISEVFGSFLGPRKLFQDAVQGRDP